MNPWAESLGPVVITGFALQQLLELIDPFLDRVVKQHKGWVTSLIAFTVAVVMSVLLGLRALRPFGVSGFVWLDTLITALLITGGTKWVNDLVKVMSYKKLEIRARAQQLAHKSAEG